MLNKKTLLGIFFFSLSMIAIGVSAVISDRIVQNFPVFFGITAIFFFSLMFFGPIVLVNPKLRSKISSQDWKTMWTQALLGVVLFRISFFFGIKFLDALEAGVMSSLTPIVIVMIGYFFFKERLNKVEVASVFISVLGILTLNLEKIAKFDPSSLFGLVLILISVFADSVFIIAGSKISQKIHPLYKSTIVMAITFVLLLPFAIYDMLKVDVWSVPFKAWSPILEYGLVANPIIYICLYLGGSRLNAAWSGVLSSLIPISAVLASIAILHSTLTVYHILGTTLVIGAIMTTSLSDTIRLWLGGKHKK